MCTNNNNHRDATVNVNLSVCKLSNNQILKSNLIPARLVIVQTSVDFYFQLIRYMEKIK